MNKFNLLGYIVDIAGLSWALSLLYLLRKQGWKGIAASLILLLLGVGLLGPLLILYVIGLAATGIQWGNL